jgi:hypothetical protein
MHSTTQDCFWNKQYISGFEYLQKLSPPDISNIKIILNINFWLVARNGVYQPSGLKIPQTYYLNPESSLQAHIITFISILLFLSEWNCPVKLNSQSVPNLLTENQVPNIFSITVALIKKQACHSKHFVGYLNAQQPRRQKYSGSCRQSATTCEMEYWDLRRWHARRFLTVEVIPLALVESIRVSRFLHSNNSIHYISTKPFLQLKSVGPSRWRARARAAAANWLRHAERRAACLQSGLRWFAMCREWFCCPPPDLQVGCIINSVWIKPVRKLCLRRKELISKHIVELETLSITTAL